MKSTPRSVFSPFGVAIYVLLATNILTLWLARGDFVMGWDLFGATFGVLALNQGSLANGISRIGQAVLDQRRPVFTGGESLIYGLIPGFLNNVHPWMLWTHFVNLVLFVVVSFWIIRRLDCQAPIYWACVLASPALVSQSIVGLPDLASDAISYSLASAWVLAERQPGRQVILGCILDALVFAVIAAIAFNGYESGKTFFVIPAIAALTIPRLPLLRRLSWLGCAVAVAWVVRQHSAGTVVAALQGVPRDPIALAAGLRELLRSYLNSYIDFPALLLAAVISLVFLRRHRVFWWALFIAVFGLVSLNAFQLDGAFLVPHRFLPLGFVSVLIVAVHLSSAPRGRPTAMVRALVVAGIAYTTIVTARFAVGIHRDGFKSYAGEKVYPLPYNRARLDAHIMPERVRDATKVVALLKRTSDAHVLFYGFNVGGEDSVNPQLFVSRILLSIGYRDFSSRVRFFDQGDLMYFYFPIQKLNRLPAALQDVPVPFYLHIREPEYSAADLMAKYFNRSRVSAVDVGLETLRSYRVEEFSPPGPIPIPARAEDAQPREQAEADGFCLTSWSGAPGLDRRAKPLAAYLSSLLAEVDSGRSVSVHGVHHELVAASAGRVDGSGPGGVFFLGHIDNDAGGPVRVRVSVKADSQPDAHVAVTINDLTVIEWLGWWPPPESSEWVVLPPGRNDLKVLYRQQWPGKGVSFSTVDEHGLPLHWKCDPTFGRDSPHAGAVQSAVPTEFPTS